MFTALSDKEKELRMCVIGDIMLDHYIHGICNRISPEAPVQVVEVLKETYSLGGAGNVYKNIFSLGIQADIFSVVGNDSDADIMLDKLLAYGTTTNFILKDEKRCTTVKTRVLASNHQLLRLDRENIQNIGLDKEEEILDKLKTTIKKYNVVLISDYNKGLLSASLLSGIIAICRDNEIRTIVDPKGLDFSKYYGVNIIKPNKKEAVLATGITITDTDSIKKVCLKLLEISGCDDVIITMSEDGVALYTAGELTIIPTKAQDILDVTGAGDTVLSALGVAISSGKSIYEACDFANHAAAVVINKIGSASVTMQEIDALTKN